jgi:hypothetical protein
MNRGSAAADKPQPFEHADANTGAGEQNSAGQTAGSGAHNNHISIRGPGHSGVRIRHARNAHQPRLASKKRKTEASAKPAAVIVERDQKWMAAITEANPHKPRSIRPEPPMLR